MSHDLLIVLHAATGVVSLLAGVVVVLRHRLFAVYLWALIISMLVMALAVGIAWPSRSVGTNLLFGGLVLLGAVMVRCGVSARSVRPGPFGPASQRFLDLVGFTLISLFDGFIIVAVIRRGGTGWLALAMGASGVLVGRAAMHRVARGVPTAG
jgi:hypothetical protein